jgi:hypothetical protein
MTHDTKTEDGDPTGGYGASTGVGNPQIGQDSQNPDWNRPITDEEAQRTAQHADPDDLGGTGDSPGLTAGGDGTEVRPESDTGGGTPSTGGYVTGGAHRARLDDQTGQ